MAHVDKLETLADKSPTYIRQQIAKVRRANQMIQTLNSFEYYRLDGSAALQSAIQEANLPTIDALRELNAGGALLDILLK